MPHPLGLLGIEDLQPERGQQVAAAVGQGVLSGNGGVQLRDAGRSGGGESGLGTELLTWAAAWPERTWAVEGAGGLGHLLAQELVGAGELVLDVQPKLAARVRLLAAGR